MGANYIETTAVGKTLSEALRSAVREASDYYGHQDGYSGAINSGEQSATLVELPPRMTFSKLQELLEESMDDTDLSHYREMIRLYERMVAERKRGAKGHLARAKRELAQAKKRAERLAAKIEKSGLDSYTFDGIAEQYRDKWGGYLAVELRGAEKKRYLGSRKLRRGERIYLFFGYAPS